MKKCIYLFLIMVMCSHVFGQVRIGSSFRTQSYYGFSGLTFIPNTQITKPGQIGIGYYSQPASGADLNLIPYSIKINYGFRIRSMEIATTNTPYYGSTRTYGGVSINQGIPDFEMVLPMFPAFKYGLMPMQNDNYQVAMAIGIALPYGAYYVVDKHVDVTFFDLTIHTGVATKLTTYHAFAGFTFTFGNRLAPIQRGFNLEMLLEGSWGGSLKQLDKKEESFIALSFRHAWTHSLFINTFIRYDNQPLIENGEQTKPGPVTFMAIGLDYQWN